MVPSPSASPNRALSLALVWTGQVPREGGKIELVDNLVGEKVDDRTGWRRGRAGICQTIEEPTDIAQIDVPIAVEIEVAHVRMKVSVGVKLGVRVHPAEVEFSVQVAVAAANEQGHVIEESHRLILCQP